MNADEMMDRASELPDRYADRLPADTVEDLRVYDGAGEHGELVSLLIAALAQHKAAITPAERDELRELAEATGEGRVWLDQLAVQG